MNSAIDDLSSSRRASLELAAGQKAAMLASESAQQGMFDRIRREAADENVSFEKLLAAASLYCRMPRPTAFGRIGNRYPEAADLILLGLDMPQALAAARSEAAAYEARFAGFDADLARIDKQTAGADGPHPEQEEAEEDAGGNPLWISVSVPDSAEALRRERENLRQRNQLEEVPLPAHLRDTRLYRQRHKNEDMQDGESPGRPKKRTPLGKVLRMLLLGVVLAGAYLLFRQLGWFSSP